MRARVWTAGGVQSDSCDAQLASERFCSTAHCLGTYEGWDLPGPLHEYWAYVLDGHERGEFDYLGSLQALGASPATVNVSWLPQYHDMGLIGSHLGTIACGGSAVLMSPFQFVRDPGAWIRALARFRGTHTQAPQHPE